MDDDLTPLGKLLESAREARRPKLSQNATAKAAGLSPTTYRRVIRGIARFGGRDTEFEGTPESIASIAKVLRVTPEQLEEVDRTDAAEELRSLLRGPTTRISDVRLTGPVPPVTDAERAVMIQEVRERLSRNAEEQQELQQTLFRLLGEDSRETG